jgi:hypothetical protein
MPKTAFDPFFATSTEPVTAARKGIVVTPNDDDDLQQVTSSLIVTCGADGDSVAMIFANDADSQPVTIPLTPGTYQLFVQVRRVMATGTSLGTGGGVAALCS